MLHRVEAVLGRGSTGTVYRAVQLAVERVVALKVLHPSLSKGRIVRRLDGGTRGAGSHETPWDGREDRGGAVASGVYFVLLEVAGEVTTRKVVRVDR